MKILSWNVNGFGARIEAVRRLVGGLQLDLICAHKRTFQLRSSDNQWKHILQRLPVGHGMGRWKLFIVSTTMSENAKLSIIE